MNDMLAQDDSELDRLAALDSYGILDTAADESFDRFVRMAAAILHVPVALISLIGADRQWLKARIGVDLQEAARSIAFCDHTIRSDQVMVVPDALCDERFANNPLVIGDPHFRFYAGAPLIARGGYRLGALCVIDRKPRELTDQEHDLLRDLAAMVVDTMELRRLKENAARQAKEMALLAERNARAQAQAERLLQQKSLFIAAMAHELRTPLNAIIGFTDLLRQDVANEFSEARRREFVDIVNSSGQHLLDLINDLLDLSKIEAGKFEVKPEPADVSSLVMQVYRMMSGLAKDHGHTFEVKIDPKLPAVMADIRALKQILVNLVSNAIKFTPRTAMSASSSPRSKPAAAFSSATPGAASGRRISNGSPNPTARSGRTAARLSHTGLGLAICRLLVQLHGSALEIESSVGNGTTVSFTLAFAA